MPTHLEPALVLFLAFILDLLIGDPEYRWHPVRMMGRGIAACLRVMKRIHMRGRWPGVLLSLCIVLTSLSGYVLIHLALIKVAPVSFLFDLLVCYSFLALKDLLDHITPVVRALGQDRLNEARKAIAMVVGRDADSLDEAGVARAAIETMAENLVDGFISPVFWYAAGAVVGAMTAKDAVFTGICVMIIFKAASTLDSMAGYKTEEFIGIGWAGARLDDAMNLVPARLSLILLFLGAALTRLKPVDGIRVAMRDRLKHDSPNSAHAESLVAGALNIRLGGPTRYPEGIKDKPWLGHEYPDPGIRDITMAMKLLKVTSWATIIIVCAILYIFCAG
jgi:adenosylcobinamide-phosphate synthase